ncbi:lipopolysaccharide biosynthesis protein [Pseudomonas guariconensis]|uniref:lipopolysaccharide biosynthesis protein n=1 Tax=Pseudomonas guariconensis TaxID=1288410 RepID=UPI0034D49764
MLAVTPSPTSSLREFGACRNIAEGAVIILASGASAKNFPITEFAHIPVIAMNGSITLLSEAGIRPFFYVCSDKGFARQQPELFALAMEKSQRVAIWQDQYERLQRQPKGEVYLLKKARNLTFLQRMIDNDPVLIRNRNSLNKRVRSLGFSKNLEHGYFDARTVAYLALQIAYHLGFSRVFLLGVDLHQAVARFYENDDSRKSPCGLDQHFEGRILPSFELAARQVVSEQFQVYNLSANSRIPHEVIPKISIEAFRSMI